MKNSTKKWLLVAACVCVCAVLVVLIAGSFFRAPAVDEPATSGQMPQSHETETPESIAVPSGQNSVTVAPKQPQEPSSAANNGDADSSGTEQTIQSDPVQPETPDEETLTDPTQKPDGTPVENQPTPENHDTYQPPVPPSTNTGGGLPGFDNVPNAGDNQVVDGQSDGDINKQVGIMG